MTSDKQSRSVSTELQREVEVVSDHVFTGEHDTQEDSLFSDSTMVEWEFNKKALFETISHKIYESDEAGVREPVFNGVSAALRAAAQGYTDDPRVAVYLFAGDEDRPMTLIIRDNGTGVSENMLKESMAHVGNSQNRYVADLMGKFGFGFLAAFRLVTSTGTFFMHTRSRETGEAYCGAWSNAGFEIDNGGDLPDALEGEYGTRLEFPVKDGIDRLQIREWVEENTGDARIPVEYHEQGFDEPYHNTDLGNATLSDEYDNPDAGYRIETDSFVAWCHPEASGRTLCLDATIRRNARTDPTGYRSIKYENPYRIDIRFTNENGSVFDAENEDHIGKTPVNDAEYGDIPEELRDKFVKRSELGPNAVETPHPTGSRDSLSDEPAFWNMLGERFAEMHRETLRNAVEKIEQVAPDALTDAEVNALKTAERYLPSLDDETEEIIELTQEKVNTVDANGEMNHKNSRYTDARPTALEVAVDADGPVFMGVSIHDGKRAVVQEAYDDVTIAKLERGDAGDKYEQYGRLFGWRKIKDIDVDDEEFDDVSEDTKNRVRRNKSRSVADSLTERRLKVHYNTYSGRGTTEVTVGDLQDDDADPSSGKWDTLVLFPSTGDAKVSSHYSLVNDCYAVARCTKKVADALTNEESIILYDELNDMLADMTVPTADGEELVDSLDDALFLVTDEDFVQEMREDDDLFEAVEEAFRTNFNFWYESPSWRQDADDLPDEYDIQLVPVTGMELAKFRPVLNDMDVEITHDPESIELRAYADLPRWRDNSQFTDLLGTLTSNHALADTMLETWRTAHEAGMTLDDVQDDD